ncbi:GntR family transcriptional regulator / MocR family aminotransferase [Micromonospora phaseoli]|uniref:GntR family transcriptional regulator / MocR family aminotransferase n=1 Tax=Micromonospora phaseoli TaxID=1144548 RepID=A0A1H6VFL9_9ACTN|nr:PLP-dependent aminotransferase family protein [Micromonospora phaseoli]PZV93716.1 GntR family transcriptional regulator/MocR family aminotransferase [Micromonospora phaseoli]SEI99460.1 GntR family transcriptional regulator / MocR family aminotransferase [Micromonospora phaseoli]
MAQHLNLSIDRDSRETLAAQLRSAVRRQIEQGTLRPGARLPSSRQLAADLGVSRSVAVEAYEQLCAEGYLISRRGSGTLVAAAARAEIGSALTPDERTASAEVVDLRTGGSDVSTFPRQDWVRCLSSVVSSAGRRELGYGPPSGLPAARHTLVGYLGRVRAVRTRPEHLMITSGFAQGLAILCRVLRDAGHDRLGVEDPGHPGEWEFIAEAGLRPVGIPVDGDGIRVDDLAASGVRAVLTTPASQFPTGAVLSAGRRKQLVAWAAAVDGYIIEDDFNAGFVAPAQRMPALQSLAPDRVVYAGSASKVLAPALRLGWVATPPALTGPAERIRAGWDIGCSGLEQLTFARMIDIGAFDRHLRRLRAEIQERRQAVHHFVNRRLPGVTMPGGQSGPQTHLYLPRDCTEQALVQAARRHSVLVRGGRYYAVHQDDRPPALVIGHAGLPGATLNRGLAAIAAAYRDVTARPPNGGGDRL